MLYLSLNRRTAEGRSNRLRAAPSAEPTARKSPFGRDPFHRFDLSRTTYRQGTINLTTIYGRTKSLRVDSKHRRRICASERRFAALPAAPTFLQGGCVCSSRITTVFSSTANGLPPKANANSKRPIPPRANTSPGVPTLPRRTSIAPLPLRRRRSRPGPPPRPRIVRRCSSKSPTALMRPLPTSPASKRWITASRFAKRRLSTYRSPQTTSATSPAPCAPMKAKPS